MSADNKDQLPTTIARLVETGSTNKTGDIKPDNAVMSSDAGSIGKDRNKVNLLDRLLAANMLVPGSSLSRDIQDDYRRIKRPLVSNAVGRNKSMVDRGNLILVTSSIPGEGKTYTSVNLALSIAHEMDTTVLLVDSDVAKQGLSRMLGIEKVCGLVDVLESDDLSIGDVMLQTDIPKLRVVSAGKQNEYVAELLTSQRMVNLVNEITSRYSNRIIIFDGPPLLPTPQAQALAGLVGQVVFVIEAGKTPQSVVEEALEMIPKEQATGLMLNKNEGLSGRSTYYYGYYGSGNDKPKDDSEDDGR
ncbi:MAG: XrtA-associated tyrosine autokinase [Gammaproteobacteria bacterium]|nr:XrtA-associated tyrosine autokinase [Gammaproteobacteria bacterium]